MASPSDWKRTVPYQMTLLPAIKTNSWLRALEGFVSLLFADPTHHGMRTFGECVSLLLAVATPWWVLGTDHSAVITGSTPATFHWIWTLGLNVTFSPTIETRGVG